MLAEKTIKWIKGALIGSGSFGQVYLGMDATNGLLMAVKQVALASSLAADRRRAMVAALGVELLSRGAAPSALDFAADSSLPVTAITAG